MQPDLNQDQPWPVDHTKETIRPVRLIMQFLLFFLIALFAFIALRQPSHDRDWRAEIAVMPRLTVSDNLLGIDQLRDWTYSDEAPISQAYRAAEYDMDRLKGVWLMVEPFGGSDAIAHTLVLFEFEDDRLLALTIEARKEKGEIYSAIKGGFNSYELVYLWAEARDVLTRRARYLRHDIYVFPLALSKLEQRQFITALTEETNRLYESPRFYNTLFSNCTNELAKTAGLSWNPAFILTGNSPQHLFSVGTIPGQTEGARFEAMRAAALVSDLINAVRDDRPDAFDAELLQGLRERFGPLAPG